MNFLFTIIFGFIFICLAFDSATAIPISPQLKRSPLGTLGATRVGPPETVFHIVFASALLFSIVGAYTLSVVNGTMTWAHVGRLRPGATLPQTIRRLRFPALLMALDNGGRVAQRRNPLRRGRVAAPVSSAPRRWGQRSSRHV
ncbi:hypothetical protein B0F90DRAFT_1818810 [Multifurca ochricompacta]|uniref:Uncharacterized protein n=1 Tax=Multifurca ochricompacta TaxID=376703 RepID=A0AAD4QM54_9AGAM|nr:hypothetical protein B0F90DRAFT_1818810 [Multifurca ochricompacta]